MISYLKKKKCGNNDLEHCVCMKVIVIYDIFIAEPSTGFVEIELKLWKIL